MEVLGHAGVGSRGLGSGASAVSLYIALALATSLFCALVTIWGLGSNPLDRARPAGVPAGHSQRS